MASQLKVDTITGVTTAGSVAVTGEGNSTTTNLQQGLLKHWCRYDGAEGTPTRDSFNQASFTDNGTGDYVMAFINNMANANQAPIIGSGDWRTHGMENTDQATTANTGDVLTRAPNNASASDCDEAGHAIAGDLA